MHEHRAFAEVPTRICTGPIAGITASKVAGDVPTGFMHIIAITDTVLANVVTRWPNTVSGVSDGAVTLAGGRQLGGIKSFDLTSGQIQILFL